MVVCSLPGVTLSLSLARSDCSGHSATVTLITGGRRITRADKIDSWATLKFKATWGPPGGVGFDRRLSGQEKGCLSDSGSGGCSLRTTQGADVSFWIAVPTKSTTGNASARRQPCALFVVLSNSSWKRLSFTFSSLHRTHDHRSNMPQATCLILSYPLCPAVESAQVWKSGLHLWRRPADQTVH